jgi:hypothetical protein
LSDDNVAEFRRCVSGVTVITALTATTFSEQDPVLLADTVLKFPGA